MIYPIFTATQGVISEGAVVEVFNLKNADISIPAITVGETGRGRSLGVLPVGNLTLDEAEAGFEVKAASIGKTKVGNPKLFAADTPTTREAEVGEVDRLTAVNPSGVRAETPNASPTSEKAIIVFRTPIGFRGGNAHTGDIDGWECDGHGCNASGPEHPLPETCPACGAEKAKRVLWRHGITTRFADFPGEVLISGTIADGMAGRMGSGTQMVALVPAGVVFRTHYSGRMYGEPSSHYMEFTGDKIISMTYKERGLIGLPSDE